MKHLGDITKLRGDEIPVVDIITGGSPCQDLSVAGLRKGIKHEDNGEDETTRSGLFMDQIRIVKEMRQNDRDNGRNGVDVRPRYMVWENVPGAFSSNGGKDFQTVLTEIVRVAQPDAPDVPMPDRGGVAKVRMPLRRIGRLVRCLSGPRCSILGSAAAQKTALRPGRFQRPLCPGNSF